MLRRLARALTLVAVALAFHAWAPEAEACYTCKFRLMCEIDECYMWEYCDWGSFGGLNYANCSDTWGTCYLSGDICRLA